MAKNTQGWKMPTGQEALEALKNANPMTQVYEGNFAKAVAEETKKLLQQSAKQTSGGRGEAPALPEVTDTRTTQQKYNDAQKAYDGYLASPEYRQKQQENNRAALQEAMQRIFSAGASASASDLPLGYAQVSPQIDFREQELKATVEHYKQQMEAEENQRVMDADMAEIDAMPEDDREQLRQYISGDSKTGNLLVNSNPLLWFQANKALGDSAKYLFDKYGEEKTKQLASSYSRYLNEEEAKNIEEETRSAVNKSTASAIGQNILGTGTRLFGGLQATVDRFGEALDQDNRYSTLAPINSGDIMSLHGNTVTAQTAQNIAGDAFAENGQQLKDGGILRQGAAYLYQGGMTIVDSLARAVAGGGPGGSAALAACNAFSQTVSDASRRGATPEQAYTLGAAVAGVEYLSEKIPLDRVFKLAKGGNTKVLAQAFQQAGIEISTEELSLLGSMAAEAAILQEKSSYKQQIGDLVANGASYKEAETQADKAVWEEVKQTALVSGFSGSISGGGAALVGNLTTNAAPEVSAEVQQGQPVQAPPAAPAAPEADLAMGELLDGIQDQTPSPEPLSEELQHFDNAAAIANGLQPAQQSTEIPATAPMQQHTQETAVPEETTAPKEYIRMEDYANNDSPVWRNVEYSDDATKASITQQTHQQMIESGAVVRVSDDVIQTAEQSFPDLWGMKKKDRTPILKDSINKLKSNLRQFLGKLSGQSFEFEVNGKILEAKLYSTGINEVLEKVTKDKASMLYSTDQIFRNARYLYSTPDYDGDTNVYRWNYFYTPVQIGNDTVGVRIAVRDMIKPEESQIYNWGIKKDTPLGGVGHEPNGSTPHDASSGVSNNSIPETVQEVNGNLTSKGNPAPSTPAMDAQNLSAEGVQGIKGTGAAERNFSGKEEYNNLLYDGNVQKDRPTDVRSMEVPKRDSDGRRVTEFAANAYAAEVTPDHMASEIESLIQDKELSFDTRSNQESLHNAAEAIEETGEEETRLRISRNASENRIQDGDIEQGLLLYTKYAADPEMQDQASSLLVDLGKLANMSGRNLQMFSLLRRMTPEGRVMTVQKNVARYVQDINKGRPARQQIDSARIIDKDLEQQLRTATTDEERQEIENAIYKDVASQIKPTLGEAWDAWRNLAMLGNPKTHARNFISTGAWKPYAAVKRDISAVLQKAFLKQEQRTASILGTSKKDIDLLAWAKVDAKDQNIQERMGFSGTTGNEARNAIEENRQMLPGFLDKLAKGNRTLMEKEDMIWKRSEYARALAGFMKARGYTADQIHSGEVPNGVLEDARRYAIKEAQKATFNDSNEFSDWVTSTFKPKHGRAVDPILNVLKKGSVPFLRTPANVVVRAMEYNPLALGKTLLTGKRDIDSGKKSAADVVNDISAGLTGTAAMGIGAMLAAGMVPGVKLHGKVDDEDALREGVKSYSLQIGNKCYSMAWLAPSMIPLFTGANIYNRWTAQADGANADVDGWDLVEALKDVAVDAIDPILELSMLSNLNDIIDNVAYEEDGGDKLMAFFLNAVTSYMFQGLPTIFGQIEQSTEETKSSTYINTDNKTEATVKRALSSASQRLPGLDLYQTEKLNEWGEPVKNEGSPLERAMAAMFSPSSVTEVKDDAITKEITRLNRAQSENVSPPSFSKIVSYTDIHGNIHANVRLTEEQYQTMARTQGQTSKRLIAEMLLSEDYKVMTDEQKAKAITQAYAYARETAEKATFQDHEGYSANWMNDAAEGEPKDTANGLIQKTVLGDVKNYLSLTQDAKENGFSDEIQNRNDQELKQAYDVYSKMDQQSREAVREGATGLTALYLEARDGGVKHNDFMYLLDGIEEVKPGKSHTSDIETYLEIRDQGVSKEHFLSAVKSIAALKPEGEYKNIRDIQQREAIANLQGVSARAKDALMKAYMDDGDATEAKYDYCRKVLDMTAQEYVQAYRVQLDGGQKTQKIEKWISQGYTREEANILYRLFAATGKTKIDSVEWAESWE